jgi:hypothetical protein
MVVVVVVVVVASGADAVAGIEAVVVGSAAVIVDEDDTDDVDGPNGVVDEAGPVTEGAVLVGGVTGPAGSTSSGRGGREAAAAGCSRVWINTGITRTSTSGTIEHGLASSHCRPQRCFHGQACSRPRPQPCRPLTPRGVVANPVDGRR